MKLGKLAFSEIFFCEKLKCLWESICSYLCLHQPPWHKGTPPSPEYQMLKPSLTRFVQHHPWSLPQPGIHSYVHQCLLLRIWIRWIRIILASRIKIRIRKNMRIHGAKYEPKTEEKQISLSKPKSELLEKEKLLKISLFLNDSSNVSIKISEKKEETNLKIILWLKRISKS